MGISYSLYDLILYLLLYAFAGWALEVCFHALKSRRMISRSFLSLPLSLRYGITAVILLLVLPTLGRSYALQYVMCFVVFIVVRSLSKHFIRTVRRHRADRRVLDGPMTGTRDLLACASVAGVFLLGYLVVHPLVFALRQLIPDPAACIAAVTGTALVFLDVLFVVFSLRTDKLARQQAAQRSITRSLAGRLRQSIRSRLDRAYPGILSDQEGLPEPVFAGGVCTDKLVWVFLVSSLLGAVIEMLYCRATGGVWMNRSSVLYGPFSFVWGFGAVLLTITLQRIANKNGLYAFAAGFLVGGAYEYVCSVFTELLFGTVFWDYSQMPLNIGGRTNVIYCVFWGILAVLWIKLLYPAMSRMIERIPPLAGKAATWLLIFLMACNGTLTGAAMIRHRQRQGGGQASGAVAQFLDAQYDDAFMAERWPNMKFVTET